MLSFVHLHIWGHLKTIFVPVLDLCCCKIVTCHFLIVIRSRPIYMSNAIMKSYQTTSCGQCLKLTVLWKLRNTWVRPQKTITLCNNWNEWRFVDMKISSQPFWWQRRFSFLQYKEINVSFAFLSLTEK